MLVSEIMFLSEIRERNYVRECVGRNVPHPLKGSERGREKLCKLCEGVGHAAHQYCGSGNAWSLESYVVGV